MAQLQRPPFLYIRGRIRPWDEGTIHVGAEALVRALSVFEGIKGYWREGGSTFAFLALREHYERLVRSARLLHLPFELTYDDFRDACSALAKRLFEPGKDLWIRTTLYAVEGHWGEGTVTDLVITGYHQPQQRPQPMEIGISTWQRPGDASLPARIKSAANYQIGRLARMEGARQGFADMVLLNPWGRVAEASGSCVLVVRGGVIATPPPSEGCLESITVGIVAGLSSSDGIPFERRPIDRTELYVADEVALAGTLMELGRVRRIEAFELPSAAPVVESLADAFWACARGTREDPAVNLTPV